MSGWTFEPPPEGFPARIDRRKPDQDDEEHGGARLVTKLNLQREFWKREIVRSYAATFAARKALVMAICCDLSGTGFVYAPTSPVGARLELCGMAVQGHHVRETFLKAAQDNNVGRVAYNRKTNDGRMPSVYWEPQTMGAIFNGQFGNK